MNSPLHILLVEDSPDDAQLVMLQLEQDRLEAEFRRVDTEAEFAAALDSPPDLILSDFAMPHFNGLQALRIAKERGLNIPFILISGTIGEEVAVEAMKHGADDYLMKDRLGRLGPAIQIALNQRRLREEKALADIALRNSEARFRSLIENSSDEVSIVSAAGSLLYESPSSKPTLGYQPGEFLGKELFQLVHPDDLERVQNQFAQLLSDPSLHPRERFRLLHHNGMWRWVEAVGTNLLNEPSVEGIVVNYHDVTERVQAEEALRKSEEQYRSLFEDSPVSLWVEDFSEVKRRLDALKENGIEDIPVYLREHPDFVMECANYVQVLDVNSAAMKLYHAKDKSDLLGSLTGILPPPSAEQFEPELIQMANGRLDFVREETEQTLTGQTIYVNTRWSVAPGYEDSFAKVLVSTIDVTERKMAEDALLQNTEDLRRSNADLEQFAYVASHDLQEPLRMVSSFLQLLARRYQGKIDAEADEYIGFAVDGSRRMQNLIEDLLAYSRLGTRGKPFERVDANLALERALSNLQVTIQESSSIIKHADLPMLKADSTQLVQLFQNLIGNAIKFRKNNEPPRIEISAVQEGNIWKFSVQDNGIGLDPQFAERIFVIFQRLHTRAEYPGTGIGLAICKKIVERHGGRIWVESEPGSGATFYFTFPVIDSGA